MPSDFSWIFLEQERRSVKQRSTKFQVASPEDDLVQISIHQRRTEISVDWKIV